MTARTLVLFLPEGADEAVPWQLFVGDDPAASGETLVTAPPPADDLTVHGVAAPQAVVLHRVDLPDLAPNQARAAATLLAAEASATAPAALHVALGPVAADGSRTMAVVDPAMLDRWLGLSAAVGHRPATLTAAPLLLPAPDDGAAVRGLVGPFAVVRTPAGGHADDALAALLTADLHVAQAEARPLPVAIAAAPIDLLQGRFAPRRRTLDRAAVRRIALLGLAALALIVATQIVLLARHRLAANAAQARVAALSAAALPAGQGGGDAAEAVRRRLATIEGPGGGLPALLGPVLDVMATAPAIDLQRLDYGEDGVLRIELLGPDAAVLSAAANAIQARGVRVVLGDSGAVDGRTRAAFAISRP